MNSPGSPGNSQSGSPRAIGIDIGGTKIAAGLVSFPDGKIQARRVVPTAADQGGEHVLDCVVQLATELLSGASASESRVCGIGMGVCELVDLKGHIVSENCVAWRGVPVRQRLSSIAPTIIEADVRAAAVAEAKFGAGRSFRQFLFVTIGTGISSCLVLDGHPFTGSRGLTGTMASSPLPELTGQRNDHTTPTLEDLASGAGLALQFRKRGGHAQSAQDVLRSANAGDANAMGVVRDGAEVLGAVAGWLVNVLDPEAIVIGGGLGLGGGLYWESLVSSTRRHIWSPLHRDLPILPAGCGIDAGLIGAAALAWSEFTLDRG